MFALKCIAYKFSVVIGLFVLAMYLYYTYLLGFVEDGIMVGINKGNMYDVSLVDDLNVC